MIFLNNTRNTICLGQNTSKHCSQIIVVHVHANGVLYCALFKAIYLERTKR